MECKHMPQLTPHTTYEIDFDCVNSPEHEQGSIVGHWTGEIDGWGKYTIKPLDDKQPPLYLFAQEIIDAVPYGTRCQRGLEAHYAVCSVRAALSYLAKARAELADAHRLLGQRACTVSLDKVRHTIKSTEGALRHAERLSSERNQ